MISSLTRRAAVALVLLLSACASGGKAATSSGHFTAPRMLGRAGPILVTPARPSEAEFRVDFTVMVDVDGRPDMSTLRLTGNAMSDNRSAVTEWIAASSFEPATQDGVRIRAPYKGGLQTKVVVRRM